MLATLNTQSNPETQEGGDGPELKAEGPAAPRASAGCAHPRVPRQTPEASPSWGAERRQACIGPRTSRPRQRPRRGPGGLGGPRAQSPVFAQTRPWVSPASPSGAARPPLPRTVPAPSSRRTRGRARRPGVPGGQPGTVRLCLLPKGVPLLMSTCTEHTTQANASQSLCSRHRQPRRRRRAFRVSVTPKGQRKRVTFGANANFPRAEGHWLSPLGREEGADKSKGPKGP